MSPKTAFIGLTATFALAMGVLFAQAPAQQGQRGQRHGRGASHRPGGDPLRRYCRNERVPSGEACPEGTPRARIRARRDGDLFHGDAAEAEARRGGTPADRDGVVHAGRVRRALRRGRVPDPRFMTVFPRGRFASKKALKHAGAHKKARCSVKKRGKSGKPD